MQENLYRKLEHFILNLHVRDAKIRKATSDHLKANLTLPHVEARNDVNNMRKEWEWVDSLPDGGLKVKICKKSFYVRFNDEGNVEQLTPWNNYFPPEE